MDREAMGVKGWEGAGGGSGSRGQRESGGRGGSNGHRLCCSVKTFTCVKTGFVDKDSSLWANFSKIEARNLVGSSAYHP